jgi:hypothetical protein
MQPAQDLTIIHLREVRSPFPLIASPFDDDHQQEETSMNSSTSSKKEIN